MLTGNENFKLRGMVLALLFNFRYFDLNHAVVYVRRVAEKNKYESRGQIHDAVTCMQNF